MTFVLVSDSEHFEKLFSTDCCFVSKTHDRCCAWPGTANHPPTTSFTHSGTIQTLSLDIHFSGHWGLMTKCKETNKPSGNTMTV